MIISIGDELVLGQAVDTNSAWLSRRLAGLGISVREHITVGDDIDSMLDLLKRLVDKTDIILVTGGLGPTEDDLTRHALARLLDKPLQLHQPSLENIRRMFGRRGKTMPSLNRIQAMIPQGCRVLDNSAGTAPGLHARFGRTELFFFPGVPSEMKTMFDQSVRDKINNLVQRQGGSQIIFTRTLHTYGTGESNIAQVLGDIMARDRNPLVNCTAQQGIVSLRINAHAPDQADAQKLIDPIERKISEHLGNLIFGSDDQTLSEIVAQQLCRQRFTLAVAESCTGGWLMKKLTDIPGSSDFLRAGWIVYSNQAKIDCLRVPAEMIAQHGAVSEPVAHRLAFNARQQAQTNFALAVTGIAGPAGGSPEKPRGLVYIALADMEEVQVTRHVFPGDRSQVRHRSVHTALDMLRLRLS